MQKFKGREIDPCPCCAATEEETLQLLKVTQVFDDPQGEVLEVPIGWTLQCVRCGITVNDEDLDTLLDTWENPQGSMVRAKLAEERMREAAGG